VIYGPDEPDRGCVIGVAYVMAALVVGCLLGLWLVR
jgi:hypothetical protein